MILGHERQIEYLNTVLKRGRLAHAYLFHGPEHVGKYTIAMELAKALYCLGARREIGASCGTCTACKAIDANEHSSVVILDREHTLVSKKDTRKEIPIEDIREVKRRFSFAASGSETRVVIINGAEYLSGEAANAFLKLLEEPGTNTLCILIAHDLDGVLPTIASRNQAIRFSLVPEMCLEKLTKDKDIIRLAAGRPGMAKQFLDDPALLKHERMLAAGVHDMLQNGIPAAFIWSEKISGDEELRKQAITYILKMMRVRLASADPELRDLLCSRMKEIDRIAAIMATTNVNPRLALDMICMASAGV